MGNRSSDCTGATMSRDNMAGLFEPMLSGAPAILSRGWGI
jgi:hypothetical protein